MQTELNDLLSGVAPGARKRYLTVWNQWAYFTHMKGQSKWLTKTGMDRGEPLIDFILFGSQMVRNSGGGGAIWGKFPAIRFWHLVTGLDDFGKFGGGYEQVMKRLRRHHKTTRKIPFSVEMLTWIFEEYLQKGPGIQSRVELYTGAILGFFRLLRIGELQNLRMSDIRMGRDGKNNECVTIIISNSKTDQFNEGDFKTLQAVPGPIFPVKAIARLMTTCDWVPDSETRISSDLFRNRLNALLRLAGTAHGIPGSRVGDHSLRSGGATAMWRAGYDIEGTKRWKRWKSASFQGYLWDDHRVLSEIGKGMITTDGNTYQFVAHGETYPHVTARFPSGRAGWYRGQSKGRRNKGKGRQ